MKNETTLDRLSNGRSGFLEKMSISGTERRRMQDLGLIAGTKIEKLCESPFGDPCAYLIRGTVIALRGCDAKNITVSLS